MRSIDSNTKRNTPLDSEFYSLQDDVNQLIEPDMMMYKYIHMTFSKKTTPRTPLTPLHLPIQNILLAVNPFHCFYLQKASGPGKITIISLG